MKILVIHQYFLEEDDPGGSRFNELTKYWSNMGHTVDVVAGNLQYNSNKKRREYLYRPFKINFQNGIKVVRCYVYEGYNNSFLGRLFGYLSFLIFSFLGSLFLTDRRYDIVLFTSPPIFLGITGYFISIIKRANFVTEIRDLWPESAIDAGVLSNKLLISLLYKLESFLYKNSKRICVLTPAFKNYLIGEKEVEEDKIFYIPNAADFSIFSNANTSLSRLNLLRNQLQIEGYFTVIYVGAHGVANDLIQVVEAAKLLQNEKIRFLLVGDGMEKESLKLKAKEYGLKNIIFHDPVPKSEIFEYISSSDVGISILKKAPIFKTIYSNKTFDYMTCSKPVIVCIDGISKDLILNEANCGIYSPPGDPEKLANTILRYSLNPLQLLEHGQNGNLFVRENFDRSRLAENYLNELKSI